MDISKELEHFIQGEIIKGQKNIDLQKSTKLIDEGIIDSLGIMKLLTFIEESFQIQITDEELVLENFESLQAICYMLKNKMNIA